MDFLANCKPARKTVAAPSITKSKKETPPQKAVVSDDPFLDEILQLPSLQKGEHQEFDAYENEIDLLDAPMEVNLPQGPQSTTTTTTTPVGADTKEERNNKHVDETTLASAISLFDNELHAASLYPSDGRRSSFAATTWTEESSRLLVGMFNSAA